MRQAVIPALSGQANATITGLPIDTAQAIKASVQIVIGTGTATGNVQLQVSNDNVKPLNPFSTTPFTNWSNLGTATAVSAAGVLLIAQQDLCYRALRVVYTDTGGGTGTAQLLVNVNTQSV